MGSCWLVVVGVLLLMCGCWCWVAVDVWFLMGCWCWVVSWCVVGYGWLLMCGGCWWVVGVGWCWLVRLVGENKDRWSIGGWWKWWLMGFEVIISPICLVVMVDDDWWLVNWWRLYFLKDVDISPVQSQIFATEVNLNRWKFVGKKWWLVNGELVGYNWGMVNDWVYW